MKNLFTLFSFLLISFYLSGQTVRSTGTAQVRMESNMTEIETREYAKELAMVNAIENAFGTYAEQQTDMTIKNGKTSYNIVGTTKVKGDWIQTMDIKFTEDFISEKTNSGLVNVKYITCVIKGKVRRSIPKALIEYEILNHPDIHSRTKSFYHGEQLYVFFKSPVKGWLSIFLEDDDAVYRLLPYVNMKDEYQSGVPIKSDIDYLFFSSNDNFFPGNYVDEQIIFSLKEDVEYNFIYIVFSEDEFAKPTLEGVSEVDGRIIPKQLSPSRFQKWLSNNRSVSDNFQDIKTKISIRQKDY